MFKTKVAFLEGRLLSSQSEQFNKYSKSSGWQKKRLSYFGHVNRLHVLQYFHLSGKLAIP